MSAEGLFSLSFFGGQAFFFFFSLPCIIHAFDMGREILHEKPFAERPISKRIEI
jgi:hypothetical protein